MAYTLKTKIANKSNYGNKRNLSDIKYIIIHYTANDGDTDENNGKYFANNIVKASAHYFVDDDSVTQSVPDDYIAYSVGGNKYSNCVSTGGGKHYGKATNTNTLNIEICDDVKNGVVYPSNVTIENAIVLTKAKMKEYNIPVSNVIRHFDVTGKSCPAYWVDDAKWKSEFLDKLTLTPSTTSTATIKAILNKSYVYKNVDYRLVFDPIYYSNTYADLKKAFGTNESSLFDHFVTYGMKEGRQACEWFNVHVYKSKYTDLQKAFGDDLKSYYMHFINYGYKEERKGVECNVSLTITEAFANNSIIEAGKQHAFNFTSVKDSDIKTMKARVLQHAMNLDYGNTIAEDGDFQTKSKSKLDSHYVKKGECQYLVTAAEILMMLHGIDPNGVECPGKYGNGLVKAAKQFFGDDGTKITASEFLKLIQ